MSAELTSRSATSCGGVASPLRGVTAMVQGGQLGEESSEESGGKTRREEARRKACREEARRQESCEEARRQARSREASRSQEGREASCREACCREARRREARDPARRPRPTANRVGRCEGVSNDDYHAPRELAGRDTTTGRRLERVVRTSIPQNRASLDAKTLPMKSATRHCGRRPDRARRTYLRIRISNDT